MSAEVAVPDDLRHLPLEQREHQVTLYLENARDRLALAVEMTGPETVANIKAEIATMAEATKQLGLSKEIRDDATEMVRRAEWAVGKAIRKGQREGVVNCNANSARIRYGILNENSVPASPAEIIANSQERSDIYAMSDGVSEEELDDALSAARREGNQSRANVIRKIRNVDGGKSRADRAEDVSRLANSGHDSHQIAQKLGVNRETVKSIAAAFGITIRADAVTARRQSGRIDSTELLTKATVSAETISAQVDYINPQNLDQGAEEELDSLIEAATAIARKARRIKHAFKESSSHVQG